MFLFVCVYVPVYLFYVPFCVCLCLSVSICLYLCFYPCLPLSMLLSLAVPVSLFLFLPVSVCVSTSVPVCLCLCLLYTLVATIEVYWVYNIPKWLQLYSRISSENRNAACFPRQMQDIKTRIIIGCQSWRYIRFNTENVDIGYRNTLTMSRIPWKIKKLEILVA